MRKNLKNIVLVIVIAIMLSGLLGGCCCYYCCPPIQEWIEVEIIGQKPYCIPEEENGEQKGFLGDMRIIAFEAYHRNSAQPISSFTSVGITQEVIDTLEGKDIINEFLSYPGCDKLPFGRIKHFDGTEEYITAVMNYDNVVEFYVLGPGNVLEYKSPDPTIAEIDFYKSI